jgi:hypothetical protein
MTVAGQGWTLGEAPACVNMCRYKCVSFRSPARSVN